MRGQDSRGQERRRDDSRGETFLKKGENRNKEFNSLGMIHKKKNKSKDLCVTFPCFVFLNLVFPCFVFSAVFQFPLFCFSHVLFSHLLLLSLMQN